MTPPSIGDLTRRLTDWLDQLMPAGDRRDGLVRDLLDRFGDDIGEVTEAACREIERVSWAHSRHLALAFEPDGTEEPDAESRGWPAPDPAEVRRRAAGLSEIRRLGDSGCLIRLDNLDHVGLAREYVEAAFTLAAHARHLVLDLRANGGGDPATVALVAGRLLGNQAQQLSDVVRREGRRQWWTPDLPPGTALTQPVSVLVSARTFSSGEALAYHLQARGRVTVIGERTPGAADHITPIRLAPSVQAFLPEAYVVDTRTGTNWEGRGVVPDIECPADRALEVAAAAPATTAG